MENIERNPQYYYWIHAESIFHFKRKKIESEKK